MKHIKNEQIQVFGLSFFGEMLGREFYVPSTMELLQAMSLTQELRTSDEFEYALTMCFDNRQESALLITASEGSDCVDFPRE
mmetsp:Transcript_35432/g.114694  ORF Transcript_35432/g.114694 Transcript_35432/m.114694 type:complete len:82 (+) Transcript_35432:415-660(+)